MLAQQIRTSNTVKPITHVQSLAAVQTLLKASLGAITFLRSLLPEDNFTRMSLTTLTEPFAPAGSEPSSSQASNATQESESRRQVNNFAITALARGYTEEADRLLNYLEFGIFDALEKQYLKSFIFAIYLDNQDPNNIVEAYTFNFAYHTLPGTNTAMPVMTMTGDKLRRRGSDPVSKAIQNGRPPTVRDVKQSVKALLKTLIHAMHHMDALPRRRFATFKLFYTDETPVDYEPPHFQPGDIQKDKWFFMTHDRTEVPERTSIGKIDTGHHSMNLSVTSVASFLPSSSTEHDGAAFLGTTALDVSPAISPLEEARKRADQAAKQLDDAETRNIAWSTEDDIILTDEDAEGDEDTEYVKGPNGDYVKTDVSLVGIRNAEGEIEPILPNHNADEAHFDGITEEVPTRLDLFASNEGIGGYEETQPLDSHANEGKKAASDVTPVPGTPVLLKMGDLPQGDKGEDVEMLDLETQPGYIGSEAIESFGSQLLEGRSKDEISSGVDNGLDCECGIKIEDMSCFCTGGCGRWYHIWCMGFHSSNDHRIPSAFLCFSCRFKRDPLWELLQIDVYPKLLAKFQDLALVRRAIKTAHQAKRFTVKEFTKLLGSEGSQAKAMIQRLARENIIEEERLGDETQLQKTRGKGKQPKARKSILKGSKYIFRTGASEAAHYQQYFKPDDPQVERQLISYSELTLPYVGETQTQNETEDMVDIITAGLKRSSVDELEKGPQRKKVKISVATGVDLAE